MITLLIFLVFSILIFIAANLPGASGVWAHLDFSWLLSAVSSLSPLARVLAAVWGGVLRGTLDQSAWWFEALSLGLPLLLFERIEEGLFIERVTLRRILTGAILLLMWGIILVLGGVLGFTSLPRLFTLFATFGGFLFFMAAGKGLKLLYTRIIR